jgi:hypothetical protein
VATLVVEGSEVIVKMAEIEKFEAVHSDVHVPLSAVRAVRVVDDAWPELRGIRAPGTGIPGVIAVGTRRGSFGKDFAVVHGKEMAVVVDLDGLTAPLLREAFVAVTDSSCDGVPRDYALDRPRIRYQPISRSTITTTIT